jgi:hypothetical protein
MKSDKEQTTQERAMIARMKNKTLAAWLAFLGAPFGLHRFYLFGRFDRLAWLILVPTALGLWGYQRVQEFGVEDYLSWWLFPIFGFTFASCALNAIVYGLMSPENWNARFNPQRSSNDEAGHTSWMTIFAIVLSLLVGASVLLSSIVYSFQRYFEVQIDEAHKISASQD